MILSHIGTRSTLQYCTGVYSLLNTQVTLQRGDTNLKDIKSTFLDHLPLFNNYVSRYCLELEFLKIIK